jgi:hypothetical protein
MLLVATQKQQQTNVLIQTQHAVMMLQEDINVSVPVLILIRVALVL